jgi:Rad3-related DNA helicase
MTILSYFRGTPRDCQIAALSKLEASWNDADVFVLSAPTAAGKTRIMSTVAKWAHKTHKAQSTILVPNNVLLDQVVESEGIYALRNMESYSCHAGGMDEEEEMSCAARKRVMGETCGQCVYVQKVRQVHKVPYRVANYYTYLAHKLYSEVVLVDEAHLLVNMAKDLAAKHIWCDRILLKGGDEVRLPYFVDTYEKLLEWVKAREFREPVWQALREELETGRMRYLVERGEKAYRGRQRDCLTLLPLDTSHEPKLEVLWPTKKVKKVVLLSGTISRLEVEQLALAGKRVKYIQVESPIEPKRRPVTVEQGFGLSYPVSQAQLDSLNTRVANICNIHPKTKILVHIPYSLSTKILPLLQAQLGDRVLSHDRENKAEVIEHFKSSTEPLVLLGSGLYEGLDLYGDDYQVQILTKVPWPFLGDPGWKYIAETHPERYAWQAIQQVVQAAGRICRGPDDFGATFILDRSFRRLYTQHESLFPNYFIDAVSFT